MKKVSTVLISIDYSGETQQNPDEVRYDWLFVEKEFIELRCNLKLEGSRQHNFREYTVEKPIYVDSIPIIIHQFEKDFEVNWFEYGTQYFKLVISPKPKKNRK